MQAALNEKWDLRYLDLANHIAQWSRDPSTKVGAVIARPDKTICSTGFNGFPSEIDDRPERYADRDLKYKLTVHAEANAILKAPERVRGHFIYTSMPPCSECAKSIIQVGLRCVVCYYPTADQLSRWGESIIFARSMFHEAGVKFIHYARKDQSDGRYDRKHQYPKRGTVARYTDDLWLDPNGASIGKPAGLESSASGRADTGC